MKKYSIIALLTWVFPYMTMAQETILKNCHFQRQHGGSKLH